MIRPSLKGSLRGALTQPRGALGGGGGGVVVDPLLPLFANGEQGGVFRAWMLAESAGAPISTWDDTDGQTNDSITAANASTSPEVQVDGGGRKYVQFDGVDDFMQSVAGIFSVTLTEIWVAAAVESRNAGVRNTVMAVSNGAYGATARWAVLELNVTGNSRFAANSTGVTVQAVASSVAASPALLHGIYTQSDVFLRNLGVQIAATSHGGGSLPVDEELDVGGFDNGGVVSAQSPINLYGLLIRDKAPTPEEIAIVDAEFAANSPAVLP